MFQFCLPNHTMLSAHLLASPVLPSDWCMHIVFQINLTMIPFETATGAGSLGVLENPRL